MAKFFLDRDSDAGLEVDNDAFWEALLTHVARDIDLGTELSVLDVGCHRGGLLERIAARWPVNALYGVEPLETARLHAARRLHSLASKVAIVTPAQWEEVPTESIQLLTCHEVLYLIADREDFLAQVRRVLAPAGAAYLVHGCHAENPIWPAWSSMLRDEGIEVHEHPPLAVVRSACELGLSTSVRPLRRDGWVRYDPTRATYRFPSVAALFEHHYRHKLLFRMVVEP